MTTETAGSKLDAAGSGTKQEPGKSGELGFFKARLCQGMPLSVWAPLLFRNRFAISPSRILGALRMTVFAGANSLLHRTDQLLYSGRITRTTLQHPPLFIIGHWRTGTTWLHELLVLDEQFNYPTTYQCLAPFHFLVSERIIPRIFPHLVPRQRPMDNMLMGFDRPQEDEFAICNLGVPSPYLKWAFPNRDGAYERYLDLEGLSQAELRRWTDTFVWFLRRLSYRDSRRLVLKSPTHTARVQLLANTFPGAQFIHIVRDPFVVFSSTVHTWKQMWKTMGYQVPRYEGLEKYVLDTFVRMYQSFDKARLSLDDRHLHEIHYEDLVQNPIGEIQKIYDRLGLGNFERLRPKLQQHLTETKEYRTNKYELPEELRRTITERWRDYIERYGYATKA